MSLLKVLGTNEHPRMIILVIYLDQMWLSCIVWRCSVVYNYPNAWEMIINTAYEKTTKFSFSDHYKNSFSTLFFKFTPFI